MKYISLSLMAILSTSPTFAVDAIDEIKVTATRTPISADSATTAITIITKEDLAKQQVFQVVDFLKTLPGVSIASSGSIGGMTQLRMRGAEANQTLVMIDGVEMNDPAGGDEFQFEHLVSNGIERIEVIRSPMSASWGSDALAGVINIITRQADEPFSVSGFAEYGSFDSYRTGGRVASSGDKWRLSLGVSHMNSDGTNVSRDGDEMDGYKNTSINARASVDLSETLSAMASVRHSDTETEFDTGYDWMTGLTTDSDDRSDTNKTSLAAGLKNIALEGRLLSNLRVTWLDTEIASFAMDSETVATTAKKLGLYFDNQISLNERHTVTLAIDHEKTDFDQTGEVSEFWGTIYDPNQTQEISNTGYLMDYVGEITDDFTIAGSLRHDSNSDFDNITSWRVGASYKITDTLRLFASGSKGQKSPTFTERYGFYTNFIGNPDLIPEKSTGYEIGFEQNFGDFSASATYFNTDLTGEINGFSPVINTAFYTAINIDGESKRRGFELMLDGEISENVSFSTNYTYLNATEDDGTGEQIREIRRPKHTVSLNFFTKISDRLNLNGSITHIGKAIDLDFLTWPATRVELKAYTMLRIAADYKVTDNISLYGRVENALNESYENVYGFATPNRAAYFGLRLAL